MNSTDVMAVFIKLSEGIDSDDVETLANKYNIAIYMAAEAEALAKMPYEDAIVLGKYKDRV